MVHHGEAQLEKFTPGEAQLEKFTPGLGLEFIKKLFCVDGQPKQNGYYSAKKRYSD